jgi:hypothetical protein
MLVNQHHNATGQGDLGSARICRDPTLSPSLASLVSLPEREDPTPAASKTHDARMHDDHWQIGQLVSVQARTWAGINQPGGIARIQSIQQQPTVTAAAAAAPAGVMPVVLVVGVKYVVDGRQEAAVQVRYLTPHSFGRERGLRNRGLLLGRCQRCGSLRTDCGSCDFNWTRPSPPTAPAATSTSRISTTAQRSVPPPQRIIKAKANTLAAASQHSGGQEDDDDDDDDDDDSSLDLDQLVAEHAKAYRRYKRKQAKVAALLGDARPNPIPVQQHQQIQEIDNYTVQHEGSTTTTIRKRRNASTSSNSRTTGNKTAKQRRRRQMVDGVLADATSGVVASNDVDEDETLTMIAASNRSASASSGSEQAEDDGATATSHRLVGNVATQDVGDSDTTDSSDDDNNSFAAVATTEPRTMQEADGANNDEDYYGYDSDDGDDDDDDSEQETFVQPEGTAHKLPRDVPDQTKDITTEDLPSFVETTLDRIEVAIARDYQVKVLQMEQPSAGSTAADWCVVGFWSN